ncbi:hypothetical protein ACWM0Y_15305 [Lactiplantibacillus plantarum]
MLDLLSIVIILGLGAFIVGIILFIIDYAKQNPKRVSVTVMVSGIAVSAIAFATFGGIVSHNDKVAEQEAEKQALIRKKKEKRFKSAYSDLKVEATEVGMSSEKIGNKLSQVWHDAIWEDDGVKIDGKYYIDFNKAINKQYSIYVSDGTITELTSEESAMDNSYTTLKKNKTVKNNAKFKQATKIRSEAKKFSNLVTDPSGNYSTFTDNITEVDNALSSDVED